MTSFVPNILCITTISLVIVECQILGNHLKSSNSTSCILFIPLNILKAVIFNKKRDTLDSGS